MKVCDGCGAVAAGKHIRDRIERLEWATRFRPVHINVLLIGGSPPQRMEDYFYRPAKDGAQRSTESRAFFDELLKAIGEVTRSDFGEEAALGDFQRRGLFLSYAVECPQDTTRAANTVVTALFPTLLKRIQLSYRPKSAALISEETRSLIPLLQEAGWGDRLILDNGLPFQSGTSESPAGATTSFGDRLAAAIAGII